jgi:hypothetical protein
LERVRIQQALGFTPPTTVSARRGKAFNINIAFFAKNGKNISFRVPCRRCADFQSMALIGNTIF